ncbi:MAG: tetraacyldisaccharide 4'-kinase [Burkholderiaceae bacterium]
MNTGLPAGQRLRATVEAGLHKLWFEPRPGPGQTVLTTLLAPLSLLTRRVARSRRQRINQQRQTDRQNALPAVPCVIVIGNLVAGGAGKTPVTIALAGFLEQNGYRVGLICRGGPAGAGSTIRADGHPAPKTDIDKIGDEARLLARATGLPVMIGHQRAAALSALIRQEPGLDVVISDDGLQHEALRRDLELIVLDRRGLGNGRLLPAGPLREPATALQSADAIIMNTGWQNDMASLPAPTDAPVFRSALTVRDLISLENYFDRSGKRLSDAAAAATIDAMKNRLAGRAVAAVAGIANPESFFQLLESHGLKIQRYAPGDHASIDAEWLDGLAEPIIILTEKDAVKCGANRQGRIHVLRVCASPEPALFNWLLSRLPTRPHHPNTRSSQHGPTHS